MKVTVKVREDLSVASMDSVFTLSTTYNHKYIGYVQQRKNNSKLSSFIPH